MGELIYRRACIDDEETGQVFDQEAVDSALRRMPELLKLTKLCREALPWHTEPNGLVAHLKRSGWLTEHPERQVDG